MNIRPLYTLGAALSLALAPVSLSSQALASFGAQRVTIAGSFGGLSGISDLNASGTAEWRLGWVASVDATYWLQPYVGLRASGAWAQDSLHGVSLSGRGLFNKFTYDGDVVVRYPFAVGVGSLVPYFLGGAGGISLHQLDSDSTWMQFAGNFGGGLEYRTGQVGVRLEARNFVYKYDRNGFDRTQYDIAWQGGLTFSF